MFSGLAIVLSFTSTLTEHTMCGLFGVGMLNVHRDGQLCMLQCSNVRLFFLFSTKISPLPRY